MSFNYDENDLNITLENLSRKDYRFRKWKTASLKIANELEKSGYIDKVPYLTGCSTNLVFSQSYDDTFKLLKTNFY